MSGEEIFDKYLDNKCPVCDSKKDSDDFVAHTEHGGKMMAKNFICMKCGSSYVIGYNRRSMPIDSEITYKGET